MEEADLLKERLQAITDKRRVQEDIVKKRTEIDEEKLKLQYIKKKALREQWLMDGLSQQTEEEQEALRVQVQDEREQSTQLQNNIDRMDKEIAVLENQELDISENEKDILRRLKEVERTPDDIIKELKAELRAENSRSTSSQLVQPSPVPQTPLTFQPAPPPKKKSTSPTLRTNEEEPKKAMFAMEISVERDARTGQSQVVATATVTPESASQRGVKVYEDGRKSVYALLRRDGGEGSSPHSGGGDAVLAMEMSPLEVEELLRQAADAKAPSDVQYHDPVYARSSPCTGNSSRPSTPRTPGAKSPQRTTHAPDQTSSMMGNVVQSSADQTELRPDPGASPDGRAGGTRTGGEEERTQRIPSHIPSQTRDHSELYRDERPRSQPCAGTPPPPPPPLLTNGHSGAPLLLPLLPVALVSVTARSEGPPTPMQPVYRVQGSRRIAEGWTKSGDDDIGGRGPLIDTGGFDRRSPALYPESEASLNLVNSLLPPGGDLEAEPVTMVFMGYQTAEDEEEEEDIQAELVVIGDEEEEEDDEDDGSVSYHPEGRTSRVFRPRVGVAKVGGCRDDLSPPAKLPTFTHKAGRRSPAP